MPQVLVVDDEPNIRYSLEKGLRTDILTVLSAGTGKEGLALVEKHRPDVVILDVRLPDLSGLEVVERLRGLDPRLPVIIITAHATAETAIEAIKRGAFEYLLKPLDIRQLREVVRRAAELSRMRHVPAVFGDAADASEEADRIVGQSPAMQEVYKAIGRVAGQDLTVLILGESGTGKEVVARALYQHSRRADKPFLAINCAAIPESLLESELFGHERGAFTGADRRRIGKFEQAEGGTIFLDEIGDLPLAMQAKLLRLLQEQQFGRVGGNETLRADVRVIAATNQDLRQRVEAGRFRQDLFFRLNGFTIHLPALRERKEDLPLLVSYFIRRFNRELGKAIQSAAPEALHLLTAHDWPGNVRELQNAIRYALLHAAGDILTPDCFPADLHATPPAPEAAQAQAESVDVRRLVRDLLRDESREIYPRVLEAVDRVVLAEVLRHVNGSQLEASQLLGMSRTTLRQKLRALGLAVEKQVTDSGQAE